MKRLICVMSGMVGGMVLAASVAAADQRRLALWITEPIGATDGSQCNLNSASADAAKFPAAPPTLTERDVIAWHPKTARWTLDPTRFTGIESAQKLRDHCFILALDGKLVSSGMALSEYSARLSGFPTLIVMNRNDAINLELLSSNHGSAMRHLHGETLNDILRQKATTEK
jgi:hypothetical protein